jgi:hypothetical protein
VGPRGPPRTHPGGSSLCGGTSRRYVGRYERVKAACPGHAICTGLGLERASTSYPGNRPDGLFRCSAPRPRAPCARDRRGDLDGERERQRRGAGLQGRVVAHELQDLRQQEQRSEEAEEASVTDTEAAVKRPLRNTCSGTIGSSRRSSQAANAASSGPRRRGCRASRRTSSRAPGPRRVVVAQAAEGLERRAAQPLRSESLITGERLPPGRSAALSTLCLGSRHDASPMCANRTAHPAGARSSPPSGPPPLSCAHCPTRSAHWPSSGTARLPSTATDRQADVCARAADKRRIDQPRDRSGTRPAHAASADANSRLGDWRAARLPVSAVRGRKIGTGAGSPKQGLALALRPRPPSQAQRSAASNASPRRAAVRLYRPVPLPASAAVALPRQAQRRTPWPSRGQAVPSSRCAPRPCTWPSTPRRESASPRACSAASRRAR